MNIVKNVSRSYPITTIWPFGKFGEFAAKRRQVYGGDGNMKSLSKCFNCGHEFANDDDINAAFLTGHTNVFLCNSCADKLSQEEGNGEDKSGV